jgi:hypothetical protein
VDLDDKGVAVGEGETVPEALAAPLCDGTGDTEARALGDVVFEAKAEGVVEADWESEDVHERDATGLPLLLTVVVREGDVVGDTLGEPVALVVADAVALDEPVLVEEAVAVKLDAPLAEGDDVGDGVTSGDNVVVGDGAGERELESDSVPEGDVLDDEVGEGSRIARMRSKVRTRESMWRQLTASRAATPRPSRLQTTSASRLSSRWRRQWPKRLCCSWQTRWSSRCPRSISKRTRSLCGSASRWGSARVRLRRKALATPRP